MSLEQEHRKTRFHLSEENTYSIIFYFSLGDYISLQTTVPGTVIRKGIWEGRIGVSYQCEVSTCISNWCYLVLRTWNANEAGHYFSLLVFRPLCRKCLTPCELALLLCDSAWMYLASGQVLFPRIYLLADFSSGHEWNKMNDNTFRRFLPNPYYILWPLLTMSVILTRYQQLNHAY